MASDIAIQRETQNQRQIRLDSVLTGEFGTRVAGILRTCPSSGKSAYISMAERAAKGSQSAAIRIKCLECVCWSPAEVEKCNLVDCALHGLRNTKARQAGKA